jgi:hypothetical protein
MVSFNDYEEKLNALLEFDAVRKLHKRHLEAVERMNNVMFCGSCDPCRCGGNVICSTITRDIVLCINDGSCEDIERWLAFSIYGDFNPSPATPPDYTLTPSTVSSDLVVVGVGTLTLAQLQTKFGFDLRTPKINDSVTIGGLGGADAVYNGYYSIVAMPDLSNQTYLFKMWNPFKFDFCNAGLLVGDFINIEYGPSMGVYEITAVTNNLNWTLTPTPVGSFALLTQMPTCKPALIYNVICGTDNHRLDSDDEAARRRERSNRGGCDSWSSESCSSSSSSDDDCSSESWSSDDC